MRSDTSAASPVVSARRETVEPERDFLLLDYKDPFLKNNRTTPVQTPVATAPRPVTVPPQRTARPAPSPPLRYAGTIKKNGSHSYLFEYSGLLHTLSPGDEFEGGLHPDRNLCGFGQAHKGRRTFHPLYSKVELKRVAYIPGAVLPTVMVVATLLALTVAAVVSLWDADFLYFSRQRHDTMVRAHIASGFTLYDEYPEEVVSRLDTAGTVTLYDSMPRSRIGVDRKPWGLYEVVTIAGYDGTIRSSKILGKRVPCEDRFVLYCRDNNSPVTLTGKTHIEGAVRTPRGGIVYGQMGAVFFDGEKLEPGTITPAESELPAPTDEALVVIDELKALAGAGGVVSASDSITAGFANSEPLVIAAGDRPEESCFSGNIVIVAEELSIPSSCRLRDVMVVAEKVRIEKGFAGSLQVFASDSLNVEDDVLLDYPSGLFSEKYIALADSVTVGGYVVVNPDGKPDPRNANYRQSRHARVRGLVYIAGSAQLQGIVSGVAMLARAVYYSPRGYYENMICDATVLENPETAWPLWLDDGPPERKEAKWVN